MVKIFLLLLTGFFAISANGQNYNFSIPEFSCVVQVNRDRSLDISYDILFECTPGFSSVDIIDIGFPSDDFQLSSIEAGVDGNLLTRIYYSTYIDKGVEVHLDQHAIHGGERGHFWLTGVNEDMVFLDTEDDDFASVEFSTTWFDSDLLSGSSDFSLTIMFPEGSQPDSVRYHDRPFTSSTVSKDGRVVYVWEETRRVDSKYIAGISFPDNLVDGPLTERPAVPLLSQDAMVGLSIFGFIFLFFSTIIFVIIKAVRKSMRRKEEYLPPKLGLTGSGIRRGLTAPMAALLLEEKLDRVLILIIFGLLKKGKLQLDGHKLKVTGSSEGVHRYEKNLIKLISGSEGIRALPSDEVKNIFLGMIKILEKKMDGFSLDESRDYYRSVIESAWKMVAADHSAEKAGEILGDRFQWLLADDKFDHRVKKFSSDRSVLLPMYMFHYFPGNSRMMGGTSGGMSLSQACSQVAGALETTASNTVSHLSRLSSTVTSKTNPVPVSSYSSSGGSSCACACAGCACACAGGGR